MDGNGNLDIVLGNREEENAILFGTGTPADFADAGLSDEKKLTTVGDTVGHPNSARTTSIAIQDADLDPTNGLELIAFGNHYGGVTLATLEVPNGRTFHQTRNTNGLKESDVEQVVLEDVNNDDFPDLIVGTRNQGAYVLLADPLAPTTISASPTGTARRATASPSARSRTVALASSWPIPCTTSR